MLLSATISDTEPAVSGYLIVERVASLVAP